MLPRLVQAFLALGYDDASMVGLAKTCGVSRRLIYYYFHNKEEAFRAAIAWQHEHEIRAGLAAGAAVVNAHGTLVDALVAIFDTRYGATRRTLELSQHATELNYQAFRRCRDVMIRSAVIFQDGLAIFLDRAQAQGLFTLRDGLDMPHLAQLLSDGARGVNQTLPPRPALELPEGYRRMCEAILFGCAVHQEAPAERRPQSTSRPTG